MIDEGYEWYKGFLAGDESCFNRIVIRYRNGMTDFVNQFVGDYHYSEEISEDVFVLLYVKKPRYSLSAGFKTWLYSIAKNQAINFVKKRNKHQTVQLSANYSSPESSDRILNEMYLDERKIALHKALDKLSDEYKLILHLHFFDELSVNQIASLLKKRPRSVSDALYNAKKALRAVIMKGQKYEILRRDTRFDTEKGT